MMTENRTVHVLIHGRVQGVSFRAWTQHLAELHGLRGWVRNRRDGSVEAVFSGQADLVEVMLKACHQGPAGALVETLETLESSEADPDLPARFEIRRTA
jgi:acylphosphatase